MTARGRDMILLMGEVWFRPFCRTPADLLQHFSGHLPDFILTLPDLPGLFRTTAGLTGTYPDLP